MAGRTSFVIAQRVTTVQEADQILVLREGRIVERGTHVELIGRGGFYRELYDLQFREQEAAARTPAAAEAVEAIPKAREATIPAALEAAGRTRTRSAPGGASG
jgi:ABC-type multidrug transport system ATPase subunit